MPSFIHEAGWLRFMIDMLRDSLCRIHCATTPVHEKRIHL
jgi:hypothetical protein